jgi:hypothetical protein
MSKMSKAFANTPAFYVSLGAFYAAWTAVELNIDFAIWRILKIPLESAHALVGPLEFGRKAAILRSLLPSSDYRNVEQIKGHLTRLSRASLRNVFAHSFMASDATSVTFIHRTGQGQYQAQGYRFEADKFVDHVKGFTQEAEDFEKALGITVKELGDFAAAALPMRSAPVGEL